jgi:hypothetical protein
MPRTTINLDGPVLADLKRLQRKEGKSLGELASELLTQAIAERRSIPMPPPKLQWTARAMGALVNVGYEDALLAALDERGSTKHRSS